MPQMSFNDSISLHILFLYTVIVATVQLGTRMQSLTLRKSVVANPISTPFDQVLSWLCQQRDYYTAASVALSLLDDSDAVYELRGIPKSSVEDLSHHKGLLDGIKPLDEDVSHANVSDTMTSLADMAIGCMIKGGTSMSKTLKGFLLRVCILFCAMARIQNI